MRVVKKMVREEDPGDGECGPAGGVRWLEKDYPGDRVMMLHRGRKGRRLPRRQKHAAPPG